MRRSEVTVRLNVLPIELFRGHSQIDTPKIMNFRPTHACLSDPLYPVERAYFVNGYLSDTSES